MNPMKKSRELGWILRKVKPEAPGIILLSVGCCVAAGISVVFALLMRELVDCAVGRDIPGFGRAVLLYLALLIVQMLLAGVLNFFDEKVWFRLDEQLQASVFRTMLRMEHSRFASYHTGVLMSHIMTDVETIANTLLDLLPGVLSLLVTLLSTATLLILWDTRFALVLLAGGGVMMVFAAFLRRRMKQLQKDVREQNDKTWSFLNETLQSMTILKAFCAQDLMQSRLDARMQQLKQARFRRMMFSNFCSRSMNFCMNGGYLLGLVWCGVGLLRGTVSYGTLTAILQLVGHIQSPFSQLSGYIPKYYAMCTAAERLMALEEEPAEPEAALEYSAERCAALYRDMTAIRAEGLTFGYKDKMIYTNAVLSIRKGETVAFMGESGIGKSTFLKLLLSLYPLAGGSIWLEQSDGGRVPISVETRGLFAYVPQENALLSGSIWECVTLFKKAGELTDAEKEDVSRACRTACAEEFILALPQGYDTVLGEGGKGLSEGQMQRLAVARALYAACPVLLLDEATSALDEATEAQLLTNLQKEAGKRTVLIVTHRRAALALCDRVFEVRNGQFHEQEENDDPDRT